MTMPKTLAFQPFYHTLQHEAKGRLTCLAIRCTVISMRASCDHAQSIDGDDVEEEEDDDLYGRVFTERFCPTYNSFWQALQLFLS